MVAYNIVKQQGVDIFKYVKAGPMEYGETSLIAEDIIRSTDPALQWVLENIPEPVNGGRTTISQMYTGLYWVRGDNFVVGGKNYTGINLASQSSTRPRLNVILQSGFTGYDLYTSSYEYINYVYDPSSGSTRMCLSTHSTNIDKGWSFIKVS
ncbi:hypothetical protein LGZ99_20640 [Photorhabdus temperata]|uniref:Uncharacterized protein n=1 Tax=Photorhabdus cinerea TaxID=471575 RepID=A0A7X5QBE9_9GAMM|nr:MULTISPECIES: hypothetical protein [Photorhabdus]MCT8349537.1 hypothetical protein [Photorhabdus temperata]NHB91226.1 hypothetical protein [Photorhabdus cinerea]